MKMTLVLQYLLAQLEKTINQLEKDRENMALHSDATALTNALDQLTRLRGVY